MADHKRVSKEFREKYHELKMERLQCIQVKVKAVLDVELDIDSMTRKPGESALEDELPVVESNATVTSATQFGEEGEPDILETIGEETDPTNIEEIVNQGGDEFINEGNFARMFSVFLSWLLEMYLYLVIVFKVVL